MDVELNIKSRPENVFAEEIALLCFLDRAFEDFGAVREFSADVDVRGVDIKRVTRDEHSLERLVRIFVNDVAVFEGARLRFVGIADQICRPLFARYEKAPLQAAGESRPA